MEGKLFIFITSSDNNAKGGHFRSCLTIAESLYESGVNLEIINVGKILSPVFKSSKIPITFYKVGIKNSFSVFGTIAKKAQIKSFDKLLAFDFFSFFIITNISLIKRCSIGYVRCGGRNPLFAPFSTTVICFSRENYNYFHSTKKFENSRIEYIPNRVKISGINSSGNLLRDKMGNNNPIILRIGRIVNNYTKINLSAFKLSGFLTENSIPHNLVFIGYPDDYESEQYLSFKKNVSKNNNCFHFDQIEFTKNASSYLDESFVVIGTGRGAMEAIVKGKILAIYGNGYEVPILLEDEHIFNSGFDQNFSQRVKMNTELTSEAIYSKWLKLFNTPEYSIEIEKFQNSKKIYFDINEAIEKYKDVIFSMKGVPKFSIVDYVKQLKLYFQKLVLIARNNK